MISPDRSVELQPSPTVGSVASPGGAAGAAPRSDQPSASVGSDTAAWSAVLDDLEAGLVAHFDGGAHSASDDADAVDSAGYDRAAWVPPAGLGPIPDALRPRAIELVGSLDARHAELAAAATAVRDELDALAPMGPAARPTHRTVHVDVPAPRLVDHDA